MRGLAVAGIVAVVVGLGLGVKRYRSTATVTPYDLATRPLSEVAAEGKPLGLEPVKVGTLTALIRRPVSGHSWLLYWGGNTSTYFREALGTIEGLQLPPEIGLLVVAPPGYDSEGHPSPASLERDAVLARDWLKQQEGAERIVTGGFSMGIYSALVSAEKDVRATVVMGTASVFEASDASPFIRLKEPDRYRIRKEPPKVPALVIQGEHDELEQGKAVAAWLGARLLVLPGVHHVETQRSPEALRQASEFIQKYLN
ncbi:MAG: hypothetical protein Q8K32_13650 [Archangium sp.]|nr:hypothetical protein [Archangium sp.]